MPLTDARDNFSRLVTDVENISEGLYVLTKGGKPAIALINIKYLESIMEGKQGLETSHIPEVEKEPTPAHQHHPHIAPKPHPTEHPVQHTPSTPPPPPMPPPAKPNFEVPHITPAPIGDNSVKMEPKTELKPPSYDAKPTINPTWTGETSKPEESKSPITSPPPLTSSTPTPSVTTAPVTMPPPAKPIETAPAKPTINPWPIIPPRMATTNPAPQPPTPGQDNRDAVPTMVTSKPTAPAPLSNQPPVNPEDSYPKMVAPPPPPPPSSLPRIPSSFQTVPVPVNGNKPPVTATPTPAVTLPPPPKVDAPAPFGSTSTNPSKLPGVMDAGMKPPVSPGVTPPIQFDQPPTTIPDPGEGLTTPPPTTGAPPPITGGTNSSVPGNMSAPKPADTPPPSIQDLEI